MDQSARELEPTTYTTRKGFSEILSAMGELHKLEEFRAVLGFLARDPVKRSTKNEILARCQMVKTRILEHNTRCSAKTSSFPSTRTPSIQTVPVTL